MEILKPLKYKKRKFIILIAVASTYLCIRNSKDIKETVEFSTIEQITELRLSSECECRKHEEIILAKQPKGPFIVYLNDKKKSKIKKLYSIEEKEFLNMRFTCDLYKTLRRGPYQQIIGISLYGHDTIRFYYHQVKDLIREVRDFYANKWLIRIYYNRSLNQTAICEVECLKEERHGKFFDLVDFCDSDQIYESYEAYRNRKAFNADYIHAMMW
jgi:hypothetical protein